MKAEQPALAQLALRTADWVTRPIQLLSALATCGRVFS
jgi:hypothetical protein